MTDDLDLALGYCDACHSGSPRVTDEEIARFHPQVPDWEIVTVDDVPRLVRTFRFKGWKPGVAFVAKLAALADETDHHPRITLDWGYVTVEWWTHAIGGLHKNDFIMAAKVDRL